MRVFHVFIPIVLCLAGCKNQYLTGTFSRQEFIDRCEWKTKVKENYKPNSLYIDSLSKTQPADVKLFLGTWCSDSKKWVPRFFAIQPKLPVQSLEIISIDTTKKDAAGLTKQLRVDSIPTFIFYREGKEIGRFVEKPAEKQLEKQLYQILKSK